MSENLRQLEDGHQKPEEKEKADVSEEEEENAEVTEEKAEVTEEATNSEKSDESKSLITDVAKDEKSSEEAESSSGSNSAYESVGSSQSGTPIHAQGVDPDEEKKELLDKPADEFEDAVEVVEGNAEAGPSGLQNPPSPGERPTKIPNRKGHNCNFSESTDNLDKKKAEQREAKVIAAATAQEEEERKRAEYEALPFYLKVVSRFKDAGNGFMGLSRGKKAAAIGAVAGTGAAFYGLIVHRHELSQFFAFANVLSPAEHDKIFAAPR